MKGNNMKNNESKSICSKCNGRCCSQMGCEIFPIDLGEISVRYIFDSLMEGNISVDIWDGDIDVDFHDFILPQIYFLRMRNINSPVLDFSLDENPCVKFVDGKGCVLSWEERPLGGKSLVPHPSFHCQQEGYDKMDCAREWKKYQNILCVVVQMIKDME